MSAQPIEDWILERYSLEQISWMNWAELMRPLVQYNNAFQTNKTTRDLVLLLEWAHPSTTCENRNKTNDEGQRVECGALASRKIVRKQRRLHVCIACHRNLSMEGVVSHLEDEE